MDLAGVASDTCGDEQEGGGSNHATAAEKTLADVVRAETYIRSNNSWFTADCRHDLDLISKQVGRDIGLDAIQSAALTTAIGTSESKAVLASGQTVQQYFAARAAQGLYPNAYTENGTMYWLVGGTDPDYMDKVDPGNNWKEVLTNAWVAGATLHELLHTLNVSDPDLKQAISGNPLWQGATNSGRASTVFAHDCFSGVK